jgi:hypothetical protein
VFKKFWFYFNAVPVAFSILFFSINLLFVWGNDYKGPAFAEAVEHCKDVSNDTWADNERTHQDVCVDMFMGGDKDFISSTFDLFWVLGLLISLAGVVFIIPLSIYLLLSWRKHRYGHY